MTTTLRGSDNFTTDPTARAYVRVQSHAGYGSTNTMIRRFANILNSVGTDISYADSAANGGSFTIVNSGTYAITSSYSQGGDSNQGISLNSAQLTTDISTITAANKLAHARATTANAITFSSWTGPLVAGDVVRAHGDGAAAGNPAYTQFTIARIA